MQYYFEPVCVTANHTLSRCPVLPLSGWLTLAVKNLQQLKEDRRYKFFMGEWHRPVGQMCFVCVAGSLLARTFEMDYDEFVSPISTLDLNPDIAQLMMAINECAKGRPEIACHKISWSNILFPETWHKRNTPGPNHDVDSIVLPSSSLEEGRFISALLKMAGQMKEAGL